MLQERPALDTDESGLWALLEREETRLRRSPFLVRDTALTDYLQGLVCKLVPDHCRDIRMYLVRTPLFNASMSPNGMMQVWTGLLLRVTNETQLSAVLGHERVRSLERHSLERLRETKGRSAFAQFVGLFSAVGALAQLGVLASLFSFSREHEVRADRLGMTLLQCAGCDGSEAAAIWGNRRADLPRRSPMTATHPPPESRRDDLACLLAQRPDDTSALFSCALARQQRGRPEDAEPALADLQRLVALPDAPTAAHRVLGLLQRRLGEADAAAAALYGTRTRRRLIRSYLEGFKP